MALNLDDDAAFENTDTVIHVFKETEDQFSSQNTVFVTRFGGMGICVGGLCIVKHPRDWHAMAAKELLPMEPKSE